MSKGSIDIICGPMFSGKTTELLRHLEKLTYANKKYILFKHSNGISYDKKVETKKISSDIKFIRVDSAIDIKEYIEDVENIHTIAIDDAQLFQDNKVFSLIDLVKKLKLKGIKVLINGLDMDYKGNPYGLMPQLMAIADSVMKIKAICSFKGCMNEAEMSFRSKVTEDYINEEGELCSREVDVYEARCFDHWSSSELFDD